MWVECFSKADGHAPDASTIALDFESRTRSRGKAVANNGHEVAWFFEQGEYLRDGDCLLSKDGQKYLVQAAPEAVSKVTADDAWLLMRVAYHLGNRHVALCVKKDELLYQPDYVLDDMVRGLGATVSHCDMPFQPEDGAYSGAHSQQGAHSHNHE